MGHLFLLAILIPFFAFFMLRDVQRFVALAMDRLPPQHVETSVAVWRELNRLIGRYIRGLVLDGLVVALREEGVLLIGSGHITHNLRAFFSVMRTGRSAGSGTSGQSARLHRMVCRKVRRG